MKTTYYIHGMHCNGCVKWSTRLVSTISGVNSVQIDLVTGKLDISSDREVSFDEVKNSLKETKFILNTTPPGLNYVLKMWYKKFAPLIIVFTVIILWTLTRQFISEWNLHNAMHDFMGSFFLIFGGLKVCNWGKFAESFQGYDPLAKKFPIYSYVYPAIEVLLGVVYQFRLGEELLWNIISVLIMAISIFGIVKVLKQGETVTCACLGGYFNIPVTWFTVFENVLMIVMAVYMQIFFGAI